MSHVFLLGRFSSSGSYCKYMKFNFTIIFSFNNRRSIDSTGSSSNHTSYIISSSFVTSKFGVCNISCYIINFKPEFDVLFGKVTRQFPHSNFYSPTDEIIRVSCWSFSNFFVFKVYWCFNSIPRFFFPCVTYSTSCFCFCHYIDRF